MPPARKSPVEMVQKTIEDPAPAESREREIPMEVRAFAESQGFDPTQLFDYALTRYNVVVILPSGQKYTRPRK